MMQVEVSYRHLRFWDPDNEEKGTTVSFYFYMNHGVRTVGFLSAYYHTIRPIEDLFEVLPEPYRSCLLFNLDLIEQLRQDILSNDGKWQDFTPIVSSIHQSVMGVKYS